MNNCPNCGGAIDLTADKCAYCGTPYYDLSCIPFHEPFILRLNVGTKEKPRTIMKKVYLSKVNTTIRPVALDIGRDFSGHFITETFNHVEFEMTFVGL